jgi:hypothetical protein
MIINFESVNKTLNVFDDDDYDDDIISVFSYPFSSM